MTQREFKLERFFARWEFTAPHLLCASDCESMTLGELLALSDDAARELQELRLGYTESQGDLRLREAVAARYATARADDVVVTSAPVEAILVAMNALVEPGDHVVVQTPCYQTLLDSARTAGARVDAWPMSDHGGSWSIDLDALAGLVTPNTRLLVVNFPHNPTGFLPTREQYAAIVRVASRVGAVLFCDEMYRGLEHRARERLPSGVEEYERAVALGGMSKSYGLAGLRVGWLVCPDANHRAAILAAKDFTTICAPGPAELLARVAVEHHDTIVGRNVERVVANRDRLRALLTRWNGVFAWREPRAGSVCFPRLVDRSAEEFCRAAREDRGLLLAPSALFDFGDSHVRWGLGRDGLADKLALFDEYLAQIAC